MAAATKEAPAGLQFSADTKKRLNSEFRAEVPLKKIHIVEGFNPRGEPITKEDIVELADAIKASGLNNPLTVRPKNGADDEYNLVAGERRYRACASLGYKTVPVIVRVDLDDNMEAMAVACGENGEDARLPIKPIHLARALSKLAKEGWSVDRIAKATGNHPQRVRRCLHLMDAPKDLQKQVEDGSVSLMGALELTKLTPAQREKMKGALHPGMSVPDIRKAIKQSASESATPPPGVRANRQKGDNRAAALLVRRSNTEKTELLKQYCYVYVNPDKGDEDTEQHHEIRGIIGALLWERGELEEPLLPPRDPSEADDPAAAKKDLKRTTALIESYAKQYDAPTDSSKLDDEGADKK